MSDQDRVKLRILMSDEATFGDYFTCFKAFHKLHAFFDEQPPSVEYVIEVEEVAVSESPYEQHVGTPFETPDQIEYKDTPFTTFRTRAEVCETIEKHFGPDKSAAIIGEINTTYPVQKFENELPVDGVLRTMSKYIE